MSIIDMAEKVRKGELRSQDLVSGDLAKIEENKRFNAVIELNPEAADIAKALDSSPEKKGALYGVPILIKDNISTGDKMRTSAGSVALSENIAKEDAEAARLLREAGAVILGKANLTEFANYMSDWQTSPMPNGYSSRGGQTMHPTHPEADASGSSTGSAVAVALGLCVAAIGSETYGSIISPAQRCGVVGIKPTDGLISKKGVLPISFTLDTLGPMARTVEDAAAVLGVLAGKQYDLSGKAAVKVGICRQGRKDKKDNSEWLKGNEAMIEKLKDLGIILVDMPDHNIEDNFVFPIMKYEFRYAINSYLDAYRKNPSTPKDLSAIIKYNEEHADIALKYGQGNLVAANNVQEDWKNADEYVKGIAAREEAKVTLDKYFDDNGVDLLYMAYSGLGIAAATGFPSMTLPIGKTEEGLPIPCTMIGKRLGEETLMRVMKVVEGAV
ncbi:MAG: amidase family protein [Treponema sp.]|nr:amidase family protein [Treponema sp.]